MFCGGCACANCSMCKIVSREKPGPCGSKSKTSSGEDEDSGGRISGLSALPEGPRWPILRLLERGIGIPTLRTFHSVLSPGLMISGGLISTVKLESRVDSHHLFSSVGLRNICKIHGPRSIGSHTFRGQHPSSSRRTRTCRTGRGFAAALFLESFVSGRMFHLSQLTV